VPEPQVLADVIDMFAVDNGVREPSEWDLRAALRILKVLVVRTEMFSLCLPQL
jgi:hypothetical protein